MTIEYSGYQAADADQDVRDHHNLKNGKPFKKMVTPSQLTYRQPRKKGPRKEHTSVPAISMDMSRGELPERPSRKF